MGDEGRMLDPVFRCIRRDALVPHGYPNHVISDVFALLRPAALYYHQREPLIPLHDVIKENDPLSAHPTHVN